MRRVIKTKRRARDEQMEKLNAGGSPEDRRISSDGPSAHQRTFS
jgi:hypothetical protein